MQIGSPSVTFRTDIPPSITVPDSIETRIGVLNFKDGFPDDATVQRVYDNLDFQHAVQAFLSTMPAASLSAMREGLRSIGVDNGSVALFDSLMDSRSLFLTANTETVYAVGWLDLKDGPLVVETPPSVLGFVDDFWFRHVTDMGNAGRDRGKGGKYLFLPPQYEGDVPTEDRGYLDGDEYFVSSSQTYGNWIGLRGFLVNGDPKPAAENIKRHFRIYPLAQAANPPDTRFIRASGKEFNTIHAMDVSFYDEVNRVVQEEPTNAMDPETLGLLASIGIEKGELFAPDTRMKRILAEAALVGSATARALGYKCRAKEAYRYPNSAWLSAFYCGNCEFLANGVRALDARTLFFFQATGVTPAMAVARVGVGSQYAGAWVDSRGRPFDGGKTYRIHLPSNVPARDFWSIVLYDTQTRSELQTDQQFPSLGSQKDGVQTTSDGSIDVYFGPEAPRGKENNWLQTLPGKGWFVIFRLYGPLEPWFDKSWRPSEIELVE